MRGSLREVIENDTIEFRPVQANQNIDEVNDELIKPITIYTCFEIKRFKQKGRTIESLFDRSLYGARNITGQRAANFLRETLKISPKVSVRPVLGAQSNPQVYLCSRRLRQTAQIG